ncbi:ribokinase [Salinicola sp. JS01]|uniref:ribokinase n=1 Tax=Salinicola sp. JS01 TaxID=3050071 RepID=UPI00255B9225|nr:ribokinase [Salinicola sp. JS01]WIX34630.1 ribokinase [Salinicola sp. JS01]
MIYNYGSINIDYVYRVPHLVRPGETLSSTGFRQVLGGKGANQSLALARAGGQVAHWGRLGQADRWALEPLTKAGVDTAHVELTADASGHALIQVDDDAENAIILYPGANHGFSDKHLEALIGAADDDSWLLMQNECNAAERIIRLASERGLAIAFNPAPLGPEVAALPLSLCRILFLNRGEAAALVELDEESEVDTLLNALAERLPEVEIVLTLGRDGVCHQLAGERIRASAHQVEAVDTTAAGDTFIGYFMAARQRGDDVEQALRLASAASALCVQQSGAAPSIPLAAAVESALDSLVPLRIERA